MKRVLLIFSCVLLTGMIFQACKPSDEKIKAEVEQALADDNYLVTATVKNGIVTLEGVLVSDEQKANAEELVSSLNAVKSVVNNIIVPPPAPVISPDDTIRTVIEDGLLTGGFKEVKVEVKDKEVTLTGSLKKADLDKVMKIVNASNPAKVNNKLKLK